MSFSASRILLRQSKLHLQRTAVRNASTTSEAVNAASSGAAKAKGSAQQATSKASEGLSKVTSSAGSAVSQAGSAVSSTVSRTTGRIGRLINLAQSLVPPTIYYSRVGLEIGRMVFQGQKMSPPSMQTVQSYFEAFYRAVRNPSSAFSSTASAAGVNPAQPQTIFNRLRNFDGATLASGGVVVAEAIGFFTVGEMIGRFKMIGYRTGKSAPDAQVHH